MGWIPPHRLHRAKPPRRDIQGGVRPPHSMTRFARSTSWSAAGCRDRVNSNDGIQAWRGKRFQRAEQELVPDVLNAEGHSGLFGARQSGGRHGPAHERPRLPPPQGHQALLIRMPRNGRSWFCGERIIGRAFRNSCLARPSARFVPRPPARMCRHSARPGNGRSPRLRGSRIR